VLRYLERLPLGTSYPDVVAHLGEVIAELGPSTLVVDATGVGGPVVDLFQEARMGERLVAVTIIGSEAVAHGDWRVSPMACPAWSLTPHRECLRKGNVGGGL
jgi:hypothetical protein